MRNQDSKYLIALLSVAIILTGIAGCELTRISVTERKAPIKPIAAPTGLYTNVAWATPTKLIVNYEKSRDYSQWTYQLWEVQTDGTGLTPLNLPTSAQNCVRNEFYEPKALQNEEISYLRQCIRFPEEDDQYIFRWSATAQAAQQLRPYLLPNLYLRTSFAPDLSRAVAGEDTSIQESLYWLDETNAERIDIGFARATDPAWSPDNKTIVFFGNQSVGSKPGPAWAGKPYDLWRIPANCDSLQGGCKQNVTQLLSNIFDQTAVNWSPDSRWIVFDGDLQGRGHGLWLRNMESGEIIQIQTGRFRNPSFAPDGKQIVAIAPADNNPMSDMTQLYILDVGEIVNK